MLRAGDGGRETFGAAGDPCVAGTNKQCQVAFYCSPNNKCTPKLAVNAACDPATNNNCDDRVHLACQAPAGGGGAVCVAPTVVPSGAQCGVVGGVNQICSGNLYCDTTAPPSVCKPKVAQGQGCVVAAPGDCGVGLSCRASTDPLPGTCQPPLPPVCQ